MCSCAIFWENQNKRKRSIGLHLQLRLIQQYSKIFACPTMLPNVQVQNIVSSLLDHFI